MFPKLKPKSAIIENITPKKSFVVKEDLELTTKTTPIIPIISPQIILLFSSSAKNLTARNVTIIGCKAIIKADKDALIP